MNERSRIITLTTDFGTSDTYVGIMKGVILSINPKALIVDLTHAIPPQDIYEAAFSIYAARSYFPKGTIHIIVVDPGVGSDRQAIVSHIDNAFFVCPDNGVLSYLLHGAENAEAHPIESVAIQNAAYYLPEVSNTFHGRDIFAPVAAHLSLGVPFDDIGPRVKTLVRLPIQVPEFTGNTLTGQIVKIDRFGNAITNISETAIARLESTSTAETPIYEIRVGSARLNRLNRAYAESDIGKPLAIIGSCGLLEIAINGGNAKEGLGIKWGDTVVVQRFD
ncbi:MAG: SAM-dependent chlorinase/fluorinase [Candidatus Poribacteria bacterium]|nr:SAM-dependent chlorinase/fluorinase [Candidatus Poribacteria bacterium]